MNAEDVNKLAVDADSQDRMMMLVDAYDFSGHDRRSFTRIMSFFDHV